MKENLFLFWNISLYLHDITLKISLSYLTIYNFLLKKVYVIVKNANIQFNCFLFSINLAFCLYFLIHLLFNRKCYFHYLIYFIKFYIFLQVICLF